MEGQLYKPLRQGEIRLLEVVPDPKSTGFHCDLRTIALVDSKQGYQTLSYVWGDLANPVEISVNDTRLAITRGLFDFLCEWTRRSASSLAHEAFGGTEARLLWIDAICINQQDVDERSAQVAIMHDIYSSSKSTISWLGASIEISEEHLLELETLARAISQLREHESPSSVVTRTSRNTLWKNPPGYEYKEGSEVRGAVGENVTQRAAWDIFARGLFQNVAEKRLLINRTGIPPERKVVPGTPWTTFRNIATHEYWWRVWVRQEILLSADLVLWHGRTQSPMSRWFIIKDWLHALTAHSKPEKLDYFIWETLLNTTLDMVAYGYFLGTHESLATSSGRLETVSGSPSHNLSQLKALVIDAKHARATDPRDKVFGLVGLSMVKWAPEYSLSVEQVYIDLVIKAWIEVQDASFLVFAGSFHENEMHYNRSLGHRLFLPSWVPNWDMLGQQKVPGFSLVAGDSSAGLGLPVPRMSRCDLGLILEVQGFHVGPVTFCQWSFIEKGIFVDHLMDYLYDHDHNSEQSYLGGTRRRGRSTMSMLCPGYVWDLGIPQCQGFGSDKKRGFASNYLFLIVCIWSRTADVQQARPLRDRDGAESSFRAMFADNCDGLGWTADELATLDDWLSNPPVSPKRMQLAEIFNETFQRLRATIDSKQLMIVGGDHVGWAPSDAIKGDSVWIIAGCPAPVVLRQLDEGHYIHLGPCFVPGLMDGEVARDVLHGQAETIGNAMRTVYLR